MPAKKRTPAKKSDAAKKKAEEISKSQRELMAEAVRDAMDDDFLEWIKGWAEVAAPYNYASGRRYQGSNRGWLTYVAKRRGYEDPRWITPGAAMRLADKRGETWSFKGEKCVYVEAWKERPFFKRNDAGDFELDDAGNKILEGYYMKLVSVSPVLNMAQIQGAPSYVPPAKPPAGDFSVADEIISRYYVSDGAKGSGCCYKESLMNGGACFIPLLDKVEMPARKLFVSASEFTSTLAHETVHSTGAPARLNRNLKGRFGDADYAFEELIAEFGSAMLCADLGIQYNRDEASVRQHAAYLDHWRQHLSLDDKKSPDKIAAAIAMAGAAADYVLGYVRPDLLAGHAPQITERDGADEPAVFSAA